ncbi:hypothetical protein GCM10010156_37060 [Planobispora rosea]|uniref:Uncharacterized protein n=1 Tax=Planobispora rosea TaxID=35762 RepID=A0A8J3WBE7_PLARO|nr:hypothetical protein GCM10010156_37060 [Planobispora rosea]GIH81781.1 hypothetical protein Pro02_01890 [Planobispora rosea]
MGPEQEREGVGVHVPPRAALVDFPGNVIRVVHVIHTVVYAVIHTATVSAARDRRCRTAAPHEVFGM